MTVSAILAAILAQALHLVLVLVAAPLLLGGVRLMQARLQGRRGPHPLQPLRDLARLLRKRPVVAESASVVSRAAPYAAVAATALAAMLVPSFARGMLLAPLADLVLLAGLMATARVAMALAGMDAGTAHGGLGAARVMGLAVLTEPALLLAALSFAILAGTTNLDAIAAASQEGSAAPGPVALLGFALLALLGAAAAENALPPVEDPATPFETAMAQRALLLGASGRHLALWDYHAALRLTLWLGLLAALFLPFGTAPPGAGLLAWLGGLLAWVAKLAGLGAALAGLGSAAAVMRVSRVPEFLAAALLLGLLGAALLLLFVAPARVT